MRSGPPLSVRDSSTLPLWVTTAQQRRRWQTIRTNLRATDWVKTQDGTMAHSVCVMPDATRRYGVPVWIGQLLWTRPDFTFSVGDSLELSRIQITPPKWTRHRQEFCRVWRGGVNIALMLVCVHAAGKYKYKYKVLHTYLHSCYFIHRSASVLSMWCDVIYLQYVQRYRTTSLSRFVYIAYRPRPMQSTICRRIF